NEIPGSFPEVFLVYVSNGFPGPFQGHTGMQGTRLFMERVQVVLQCNDPVMFISRAMMFCYQRSLMITPDIVGIHFYTYHFSYQMIRYRIAVGADHNGGIFIRPALLQGTAIEGSRR